MYLDRNEPNKSERELRKQQETEAQAFVCAKKKEDDFAVNTT
jgi:hypothetical protein